MLRPGDIIISNPGEGEAGIPDVFVNDILETLPLSEMTDKFNTLREWDRMHELTDAGAGIKVGVGDTGVDKTHLEGDLKGCVSRDFTGSRYGYYDRHGHGSHTTGHIGARKNGEGFFGAAPNADLMHAKVLGDSGSGDTSGIRNGIKWMVDNGCHLINLSLGGGYSSQIEQGLEYAAANGCLVFASMGNSGNRGGGHPGTSKHSFGITAMDYNKRLAGFSSRDRMAIFVGYGVQVLSCVTGGRYGRMSGTSMSCPDTVGQAANHLSYMKKLGVPLPKSLAEYRVLVDGCIEDLGPEGHDVGFGFGFIDSWKVMEKIKAMAEEVNPPTPEPPKPPKPTPGKDLGLGAVMSEDGVMLFSNYGEDATLSVGGVTYRGKVTTL